MNIVSFNFALEPGIKCVHSPLHFGCHIASGVDVLEALQDKGLLRFAINMSMISRWIVGSA